MEERKMKWKCNACNEREENHALDDMSCKFENSMFEDKPTECPHGEECVWETDEGK
jgi:hypothetical protein